MSSSEVVLAVAVFLASAVEMIEALTIVLAVGVTRGWKSALEGVLAALCVLAVIVLAFGPALVKYVPINLLRSVVGGVLLIFGLQWLRKAVLRASGLKEKRNEDLVYRSTVTKLATDPKLTQRDMQGFTLAFKGVFIEGLEVIIIVLTLGSSAHDLGLAIVSALVAFVTVALVGIVVSRQLSGVPENAMKLMVGLMLVSFGTFWGGEGMGVDWPGSDLMIPVLVLAYGVVTFALVKTLVSLAKARSLAGDAKVAGALALASNASSAGRESVILESKKALPVRLGEGFLKFWWEFFIGDTPELFIGTLVILAVVELLLHSHAPGFSTPLILPVLVMVLLNSTVLRAYRHG